MERTMKAADEREQAIAWLMKELDKGRKSGEEHGWLTLEEVEAELGISNA
jgi:hypothetical protein